MCLLVGATFFEITVAVLLHELSQKRLSFSPLEWCGNIVKRRVERRPENSQVKKPPESWKVAAENQVLSL